MKHWAKIVTLVVLLAAVGVAVFFGLRSRGRVRRADAALAAAGAQTSDAVRAKISAEQSLRSGPMPIDAAIHALATRGRLGVSPDIAPLQTGDPSPLSGWVFQSHDVPDWMLAPPATSASATP